jgi:transketolase
MITAPARTTETDELCAHLGREAADARLRDLEMVTRAKLGHVGGELSVMDILTVLYGAVLKVDPRRPDDPARDRLILSKGHAACALYVTLAKRGFFPLEELSTFMRPHSRLNGHPDRNKVPGVETNTGPLGHGLPVAVGSALAARLSGGPGWRTFVVTGDGELQEGSNWEAAMAASHYRLDNLTVTVDRNRIQQGDATESTVGLEPLGDRFRAFGFAVREVDGHDLGALLAAYRAVPFEAGKPSCLIAHTVKGKGVSFMEDNAAWHHKVPSEIELERARAEIEAGAGWSQERAPW